MNGDQRIDRAKELLRHYFKLVFNGIGMAYDSDNMAELDELIDYLVDGIEAKIAEQKEQSS